MHYPPYSALANVLVRSDKLDEALRWSGILGKWFETTRHEGVRVLGPGGGAHRAVETRLPVPLRAEISQPREAEHALRAMLAYAAAQKIPRTQVIVDVDALWLM